MSDKLRKNRLLVVLGCVIALIGFLVLIAGGVLLMGIPGVIGYRLAGFWGSMIAYIVTPANLVAVPVYLIMVGDWPLFYLEIAAILGLVIGGAIMFLGYFLIIDLSES